MARKKKRLAFQINMDRWSAVMHAPFLVKVFMILTEG